MYPAIHLGLVEYVKRNLRSRPNFLDLGCCYGLLGRRLIDKFDGEVPMCVGMDADAKVLVAARNAGVEFARLKLIHCPDIAMSCKLLKAVIEEYELEVVIARRIFPELFGTDDRMRLAAPFFSALAESGIREIFIQGRVKCAAATNSLPSVQSEVNTIMSLPANAWPKFEIVGPFAHLWN